MVDASSRARRSFAFVAIVLLLISLGLWVWSMAPVVPHEPSSTAGSVAQSQDPASRTAGGDRRRASQESVADDSGSATEGRRQREDSSEAVADHPTLSGRFVDGVTRRGLRGVQLQVRRADEAKDRVRPVAVGFDGAFAVELAPSPVHSYLFTAKLEQHVLTGVLRRMPTESVDLGDIPLGPFVPATVRTVDLHGRPVSDANLDLFQVVAPWSGPLRIQFAQRSVRGVTDPRGELRLAALGIGRWQAGVREPLQVVYPGQLSIAEDGGPYDITVQHVELGELAGQVVDQRGVGLPAVTITVIDGGKGLGKTDAMGRFSMTDSTEATIRKIRGRDAQRGRYVWRGSWPVPSRRLRLVWPDQPAADLQVIDAVTNEPVALRSVQAFELHQWLPVTAEIAERGRVRIPRVPPEGCSVWLIPGAGYQAVADVRVPAEPTGPIRVRMRPSEPCSIRVQDGAGRPIAGAVVTVLSPRETNHFARATNVVPRIAQRTSLWHGFAKTGADGLARVTGTPGEQQQLAVQAKGFAARLVPLTLRNMTVRLSSGTAVFGTVDLEGWQDREPEASPAESRWLIPRPHDASGRPSQVAFEPAEGEAVQVLPQSIEARFASIDAAGNYRSSIQLPPGRWRVQVLAPTPARSVLEEREVTLNGEPERRVDFALGEHGFGRVDLLVTVNGRPGPGHVQLGDEGVALDGDGRGQAQRVAGRYVAKAYRPAHPLVATGDGVIRWLSLPDPVVVRAGETTRADLDFVYREAIVRIVRQVDSGGEVRPVPGVQVIAEGADGELTRSETNGRGAVAVDRPPASFWVRCPGHGDRRYGPFQLPAGVASRVFDVVLRD